MDIIHTVSALRAHLQAPENKGRAIGFVPTMGNLHEGHIDLVRIARDRVGMDGLVVMSIFVNRLQFGPKEDFDKYPRTLADDGEKCRQAGVDVIFAPDEHEMYPEPQGYVIEPPEIQHILDGAVRPGHFRGVATVVMKLLNMVQPSVAVFGKKDYQQCRLLDTMVRQFNMPIKIILAETIRADDGLALSSRNIYLSKAERKEAPQLFVALQAIKTYLLTGRRDFDSIEAEALNRLTMRGWQPDYLTIRCQSDLLEPIASDEVQIMPLVILGACRLGTTRLIDNLEVLL